MLAVTAAIIYGLMGITTYLGVLAVILSSLAGLFLNGVCPYCFVCFLPQSNKPHTKLPMRC